MAKLTTEELLNAFKELTLIELSEFVKAFEETFEVTAAAPVAVAGPAAAGGAAAEEVEEQSAFAPLVSVIESCEDRNTGRPRICRGADAVASDRRCLVLPAASLTLPLTPSTTPLTPASGPVSLPAMTTPSKSDWLERTSDCSPLCARLF